MSLLAAIALLVAPGSAAAGTIDVTTVNDVIAGGDGKCSLREAVIAAVGNAASGGSPGECPAGQAAQPDEVRLSAPLYGLQLSGAVDSALIRDLDVTGGGPLTVAGTGAGTTTISANGVDRLFDIGPGASLTVRDVTLTGGHAANGANGAGPANATAGEPGGAIRSTGTLTIERSVLTGNRAGTGGNGAAAPGLGTAAAGGDGGAIRTTGTLSVTDSTLNLNNAGDGGTGADNTFFGFSNGAGGGSGGAIAINSSSPTTFARTTLSQNHAGAGGSGGDVPGMGFAGGTGGSGGAAGAILVTGTGAVTIAASTLSGNNAGNGGSGGSGSIGGAGGAGGPGGAMTSFTSTLTISDSTLAANTTGSGAASGAGMAPPGSAGGSGGALNLFGGPATLTHVTIAANALGTGAASNGAGSALIRNGGTLTPRNSILSGPAPTCAGTIQDGGLNLRSNAASCPGTVGDAGLGPLQDNGGPTPTMLPAVGGAAVDKVAPGGANCTANDQRGIARPQLAACDIGAVERRPFQVTLAPSPLAFPATARGALSSPLPATLTYVSGEGALAVTSVRLAGTDPGDFVVADDGCSGAQLTPGGSCAAALRFAPAALGDRTATLRITDSAPDGPREVALTGAGQSAPLGQSPSGDADSILPTLTGVSLTNSVFAVSAKPTALSAAARRRPKGTTFRVRMSERGSLRIVIERALPGRRRGSRCVKPTRELRKARKCTRYQSKGTLTRTDRGPGQVSVPFSGRLGTRALVPGGYRATFTATDAAGNRSKPARRTFKIVRR
jgi:hypothetical protein